MRTVAFIVAWQLAWVVIVWGAGHGWWWAPLTMLPALVVAGPWRRTARLGLIGIAVGVVCDSALGCAGVARFAGGWWDGRLPPPWMWSLWAALAVACAGPLHWLRLRPWLPTLMGVISAPGAYLAGVAWSAMEAPRGTLAVGLAAALVYGVALPLLVRAARPAEVRPG